MHRDLPGKNKGFTLIELLIGLVIGSVVVGALYKTVINQQRSYTVQDEVIDMQQNIRNSLSQMAREIRMTGYGMTGNGGNIPPVFGNVNGFTQMVTVVNGPGAGNDSVTVVMAEQVAQLNQNAATGANQLLLNVSGVFDNNTQKYLCLNGLNNYLVQSVNGNLVTLTTNLAENHLVNEPVYLVKAITFSIPSNTTSLMRNENGGAGNLILADNIEGLQLQYTLLNGTVVNSPALSDIPNIREVSITITGRTSMPDPKYPGDGYHRQTVSSNVDLRNIAL